MRQPRRQRMRFQVIDRDQRLAGGGGNGLGRGEADEDAADQPRPRRCRHAVEIGKGKARFLHCRLDDVVEMGDVGARRQFGYDAAIGLVLVDLRPHDIGEDFPLAVAGARHDGRGGLVAARFDS